MPHPLSLYFFKSSLATGHHSGCNNLGRIGFRGWQNRLIYIGQKAPSPTKEPPITISRAIWRVNAQNLATLYPSEAALTHFKTYGGRSCGRITVILSKAKRLVVHCRWLLMQNDKFSGGGSKGTRPRKNAKYLSTSFWRMVYLNLERKIDKWLLCLQQIMTIGQ